MPYKITEELARQQIGDAAQIWWDQNMAPASLPHPADWSQEAWNQVIKESGYYLYHHGRVTAYDLNAVIIKLIDKGLIPLDQGKKTQDEMPHKDDPQLRWLDSVDAYKEASSDKIRKFLQPAASGEMTRDASKKTLKERFDERVTFLQQRNVRRAETRSTQPTPRVESKGQQMHREILKSIDNLGPDHRNLILKTKERMRRQVSEMIQNKKSLEEITRFINSEIKDFQNGSIR
jgi:hypothetical protein